MFRKILVPLDGSALSEAALPVVRDLAAAGTSEVVLLTVHDPPKPTPRRRKGLRQPVAVGGALGIPTAVLSASPPEYAETKDQAVEREEHELLEYLDQLARSIAPAGAPAGQPVESVVRLGKPGREIIEFARRGKVDLIVMTTHGRSGLQRTLHGNVTAAVIRSGVAPVLVIRPKRAAQGHGGAS